MFSEEEPISVKTSNAFTRTIMETRIRIIPAAIKINPAIFFIAGKVLKNNFSLKHVAKIYIFINLYTNKRITLNKLLLIFFLLSGFILSAQVPSYVSTNGLQGFWPFTGNANDVSGNAHHGTVNGAALASDRFGNLNASYNFNGSSDYISVASTSSLSGYSDMSISAWINVSSFTAGPKGIVCKWYQRSCVTTNTLSDTYEAALLNNQAQFATNNNNMTGFTSPPPISPGLLNTWVHLVFISNATQGQSIYINGTLAGTFATSGGICNSTNPLYFGADYDGNSNFFHRFFDGRIDDIGIWNRVLTNCEIQQLYTSSSGSLTLSSSSPTMCPSQSVTLMSGGASTYTWLPGNANGNAISVSPTVSTTYTVTGTTTAGCLASASIAITVLSLPSITVTSMPTNLCANTQATFTAIGATSYVWVGLGSGSVMVVNATSPVTSFTIGFSNAVCTNTTYIWFGVSPSATINVTSSDTLICEGAAVNLQATGATGYTWQPGNLTGSSIFVNPLTTTNYTVTGNDINGCTASANASIVVDPAVSLSVTANPLSVCPGSSSTLTANGATSYTWLPSGLTGSAIVVSPTMATTYTVIASNGACSASAAISVNVGLGVSISSSGNLCNNNTIDLFVTPSSGNILWTGPGIVGSNSNPSITINAGGIYSVSVNNPFTNCAGSASINITSSVNPIALNIVPSSTYACFPGPPVNMLVSASANLSWFPPSEVTPNTGPLVSVSPTVTTTYTVTGTLGSCSGTSVITISVNITPTVFAASSEPTICAGGTLVLSAIGADTYEWLPGNITGSSVTVSPYVATTYTVNGANGNCVTPAIVPVSVFARPNLTTAVSAATICIGQTATLTAGNAPVLAWLIGDPPPLSNTAVVSPTVSETYTVMGSNALGCSSTATVHLYVINSPSISALSSATSICAGESVTLSAVGGAASYTWFPGLQVGSSIVETPGGSLTYTVLAGNPFCSYASVFIVVNNCKNISLGLTNAAEEPQQYGAEYYRVRLTVTANNASGSDLHTVILNNDLSSTFIYPVTYTVVNPPTVISKNSLLVANPYFNGSSDLSLTLPFSSTLSANKRDTLIFTVMIDPNGFEGTLKNSVIGSATDKNKVIASDTSNNGFAFDPDGDGDPTNNSVISPIEIELVELFIPEGFSPDDDGKNDLFIIKGLNGRSARLTIFNRWGSKVYVKEGTDLYWDGKANVNSLGQGLLPESTYYYVLEFNERKSKIFHGFVVMRY